MRRREYLRSAVGAAGLTGLSASALAAAGSTDDASPSAAATTAGTDPSTAAATGTATADGDDFGPLARIDVSGGEPYFRTTEAVMEPDGRYAFASRYDGFYVVDCADPGNPEIVAEIVDISAPGGRTMGALKDLKYDRERVMVATDGGSYTGIGLYDVSDPTDPEPMKEYETTYRIHNADLRGEYAYLTTGEAMEVIHVAPDEPEPVARWSVTDYDDAYEDVSRNLRNLHDLYVQDGRAYLAYWDAGSWIVDVSDPENPSYVGHAAEYTAEDLTGLGGSEVYERFTEPKGNDHYVQPDDDGDLLASGGESWNLERESFETDEPEEEDLGGPSGIDLWDISDPANPERLSTIEPPQPPEGETARRNGGYYTTSHNFEISGDYLYSSWYRAGVKVHDVSDPANPEELAHWADGDVASFWTARVGVPGEFFVATSHTHPTEQGGPGGFYTFPDPTDNDATVTSSGSPAGDATPATTAAPGTTAATDGPTGNGTPADGPTATATDAGGSAATPTGTPGGSAGSVGADATAGGSSGESAATDGTTAADDESSGSGPGLGVLSGLAALGVGAWGLRRGEDGE